MSSLGERRNALRFSALRLLYIAVQCSKSRGANVDIQVVLDTQGAAVAGVDRGALIADLQAELDKLAAAANVASPKPDKASPPEGAQGDAALIHWLIDFATNPAMARVYAQGLIMAINAIVSAVKPNTDNSVDGPGGNEKGPKVPVRITISGKEIVLPVATSAIKAFLDSLGTGHSGP